MTVKRVFEGLTLVLIGIILLLNTTGSLSWSVWLYVVSLWPLLLVAAGLDIIAKGLDATWLRVLSSLLIIGGLLFGAFVLPVTDVTPGFGGLFASRGVEFDVVETTVPRVSRGEATIRGGVGSYTISDGDDLVRVSGRSPFGQPRVDVTTSAQRADVRVTGPDSDRVWIPGIRGGSSRVDVQLDRTLVWDIDIDTGVVDLDADLSELAVNSAEVRSGVSQVRLTLGELPAGVREVPVTVRGGVANFVVRVPAGVPVRIEAETGLTVVNVDRSIPRIAEEGRVWRSPGFARDGGYRIDFEAGVSNVSVETY